MSKKFIAHDELKYEAIFYGVTKTPRIQWNMFEEAIGDYIAHYWRKQGFTK